MVEAFHKFEAVGKWFQICLEASVHASILPNRLLRREYQAPRSLA